MTLDLGEVVEKLRSADSFLITTHTNPDGDAIGTMLALYHFLHEIGKSAITCASHDPAPRIYRWLPGAGVILSPKQVEGRHWSLAVIVDVAQVKRTGDVGPLLQEMGELMVLDHHLEPHPPGQYQYIDTSYAASSEIVVDLYAAAGLRMSREAATCAYVGLATDTGGFRYSNTNAAAHRRAAALVEAGVDVSAVSMRVFEQWSVPKIVLLRRALERLVIGEGGEYAYTVVTLNDMQEAGAKGEDVDGIVNFARNIEGVQVGILFRETAEREVKVSLRSSGVFNSAAFLQAFGGGGHAPAAGATLSMSLQEAQDAVLTGIQERLSAGRRALDSVRKPAERRAEEAAR